LPSAGQYVGAVIANTSEIARHAAELVHVSYHEQPHDTVLRAHRDDLYTSDHWESAWRSLTIANALSQGAVSSRKPAHSHAGRVAGCNVLFCRCARGERRT
jgi:xanthine dehydrogenase molybdopterin-binding subunit B